MAAAPVKCATENVVDEALTSLGSEGRATLQQLRNKMTIVTVGETGVGKSTLLNGLFGVKEFKEGDTLDPGTTRIDTHKYVRSGVSVTVHDCPGLLDGTGNEGEYLHDLKAKTRNGIDLMLYCISMKESRAHLTDDPTKKSAITIVTETCGPGIWKNAMFVLTYANVFVKDLKTKMGENCDNSLDQAFEDRIAEWKIKIQQALEKNRVDPSVVENIVVQPAGYYKKRSLPGRDYWLSDLWGHALLRTCDEAKFPFLQMTGDRLQLPSDTSKDDFEKSIEEQPIVITPSIDIRARNMLAATGSHETMAHGQSSTNASSHRHKSGLLKFLSLLWTKVMELLNKCCKPLICL